MKIFHESMNEIFPMVQKMTDGDYCLVHLMDENPTYASNFARASREGREMILDNSIFELGEAYNEERYAYWMQYLRPTYTIIPDVLNSYIGTMNRLQDWFHKFPLTRNFTKTIAVVQGNNEGEALACFDELQRDPRIDKIGISFDSASHLEEGLSSKEKLKAHMKGRAAFLNKATDGGRKYGLNKPVHLLGCSLPQELYLYNKYDDGIIDSVDTSSPVVHGFMGIKITKDGLDDKHPQKLFTLIDETVTVDQAVLIGRNIHTFRKIANG